MKKIQKKAFTLVELLVVIAILAVLATVAILGYSSFTNKANQSNDATVVAELNRFTQAYIAGGGEVNTVTDIANELEKDGFKLSTIKTSYKKDYYAFNVDKKEFLVIGEGFTYVGDKEDIFVFVASETERHDFEKDGYSAYLQEGFDSATTTIETSKGVDVGVNNGITSINYTNPGEHQEVVIRTNSYDTALVVNAPLDTVHHYGSLMSAKLQKVSTSSYYEHGDTNLVEIASGRLVITNDTNAKVDNVYLTATDGENYKVEEVGIIIATQSGAKLPDVIRRDAVTETDGKVVCTIQTNVDANGENPQKVDVVTIKGEDNVQEATNGYTNVADLTKMVLEAPDGSETEGASEFIGNEVAVVAAEREGIKNEAKGTVIEVTFKETVSLHTISEFRDLWNAGEFFDLENPASIKLTGNVDMKKVGNWGPIGTWEYPFFGTFDGNNKKISNFSNHANADANGNYTHIYGVGDSIGYGETYGFFGIVGGGNTTIQSITFENVDINIENGKNVGAVVGYVPSNSKFRSDGETFANNKWNSNGLIGKNDLILNEVSVSGSVKGKNHIGGLVGKAYTSGAIAFTNCTSDVVVSASAAGGLSAFVGFISGPSSVAFDSCESTENSKLIAAGMSVNYIGDFYGISYPTTTVTSCTSHTKLELPDNGTNPNAVTITMYSDATIEIKNQTFENSFEINRGNFIIENTTIMKEFNNYSGTTTTIKSGTFNFSVTNKGVMLIEDGSFCVKVAILNEGGGSLTITGYTIIDSDSDGYDDKIVCNVGSTIKVGNGEAQSISAYQFIDVSSVKKQSN